MTDNLDHLRHSLDKDKQLMPTASARMVVVVSGMLFCRIDTPLSAQCLSHHSIQHAGLHAEQTLAGPSRIQVLLRLH